MQRAESDVVMLSTKKTPKTTATQDRTTATQITATWDNCHLGQLSPRPLPHQQYNSGVEHIVICFSCLSLYCTENEYIMKKLPKNEFEMLLKIASFLGGFPHFFF